VEDSFSKLKDKSGRRARRKLKNSCKQAVTINRNPGRGTGGHATCYCHPRRKVIVYLIT
jgi:hypothetical protein